MFKLNKSTGQFILKEGHKVPSLASYVQSLKEIIFSLSPKTKTEARRLEIAKSHLKEIRLHVRRLQERNNQLEEQLKLLEEKGGEK